MATASGRRRGQQYLNQVAFLKSRPHCRSRPCRTLCFLQREHQSTLGVFGRDACATLCFTSCALK